MKSYFASSARISNKNSEKHSLIAAPPSLEAMEATAWVALLQHRETQEYNMLVFGLIYKWFYGGFCMKIQQQIEELDELELQKS